jgi:hypothetical protein
MSSSSSRPSGTRDVPDVPRPDRRSVGGNQSAAPPQPKAGDLLQFGTINKVAPITSAPTSVFNNKRGDLMSGDSLMSQTAPSPNMISKISHPKTSSEERFTTADRSVSVSGGQLGGHPPTMVHTTSQGGSGSRDGIRSKPGANDSNRASLVNNPGATSLISNMSPPMEPVAPPRVSANSWVAGNTALPSALATARHIKDINRITYPEGIKSPKVELNVNTQKGKFRCVLSVIDIPFGLKKKFILDMIATFCYSSGISARRSQIIFHHSTCLGSNPVLIAPSLLAEDN